jgi:hypothetical protein
MKKIFLGLIAIALMTVPVYAGGGKKAKKKAKMECSKDCDPRNCSKDPKCVPMPGCCTK